MDKPVIFLSFDDCHIDEWFNMGSFLNLNKMKVTFYVAHMESITAGQWEKLKYLEDEGHTIGHHGLNHLRARPEIGKHGYEDFFEKEIAPGFILFQENGLKPPVNYSYPMGNGNGNTDHDLLKHFKTLRYGGREYIKKLDGKQIFHAANFGKFENQEFSGHEGYVQEAIRRKAAICLYMHKPVQHRLEYLARQPVDFFAMGTLNELFSA